MQEEVVENVAGHVENSLENGQRESVRSALKFYAVNRLPKLTPTIRVPATPIRFSHCSIPMVLIGVRNTQAVDSCLLQYRDTSVIECVETVRRQRQGRLDADS